MSGARRDATGIVIGGEPRIDFLPPEVKAGKEAKKTRRSLAGLVVLVVAGCVAGYAFAAALAVEAQEQLTAAQDQTHALIQEQGEYSEVRTVTGQLTSTANARLVGSATEMLWQSYLAQLVAVLPDGASIDTYTVTSQSATEGTPVTEIPLQNARMATINFVVFFPSLTDAQVVLKNLEPLPGFADGWVTPIELKDEGGYTASFTLNVNADVVERRFFTAEEAPAATESSDATTEGKE